MSVVSMKQLLEAGVHFGHQTHKWNPKMKKYIFIKRNGIHIIDLKQTVDAINEAYMFLREVASKGQHVLFIGTKKQATEAIIAAAKKCDAFYVNQRWYGGMLTNMRTIRTSLAKLDYYEQITEDGTIHSFTKFEATLLKRKYDKINHSLGGIRGMDSKPGAVFVVDVENEDIAVREATRLGVPIIGMVDTNSDPDPIDYVIPANDDAIRAIHLISDIMAKAVFEGKQRIMEGADVGTDTVEASDAEQTEEVADDDKTQNLSKEKAKADEAINKELES